MVAVAVVNKGPMDTLLFMERREDMGGELCWPGGKKEKGEGEGESVRPRAPA